MEGNRGLSFCTCAGGSADSVSGGAEQLRGNAVRGRRWSWSRRRRGRWIERKRSARGPASSVRAASVPGTGRGGRRCSAGRPCGAAKAAARSCSAAGSSGRFACNFFDGSGHWSRHRHGGHDWRGPGNWWRNRIRNGHGHGYRSWSRHGRRTRHNLSSDADAVLSAAAPGAVVSQGLPPHRLL